MCNTCGCHNPNEKYTLTLPCEEIIEDHSHTYGNHSNQQHEHTHSHSGRSKTIQLEKDVLYENNLLAERNRGYFEAKNIKAYNLVSSPGSGKTALLEQTIKALNQEMKMYVIEGDQQTSNDAKRIHQAGAKAIQVNTGSGCHLDAEMVNDAVKKLAVEDGSIVFIENVGNLVCPALFDLGETKRVAIISVTEGEDKPLKYPYMFESANICIINKTDLLPYLDVNIENIKNNALQVNHHLEIIELSVKSGEGFDKWLNILNVPQG